MLDTTPLTTEVARFADRLRSAPQSRLQRGAAAVGLALARELSGWARRLEDPEAGVRIMPDAGMFVVADQLVVAGNDLAQELRTAPSAELDKAVRTVEAAAVGAGL